MPLVFDNRAIMAKFLPNRFPLNAGPQEGWNDPPAVRGGPRKKKVLVCLSLFIKKMHYALRGFSSVRHFKLDQSHPVFMRCSTCYSGP